MMKLLEDIFHYYGDIVRKLFLLGAVIMLVTLPSLNSVLPYSLFYSLLAILALSVVAGFTSPNKKWGIAINELVAMTAVLIFEYYAVISYVAYSASSELFIVNQILALDFLIALYYNTKTLRGMVAKDSRFKDENSR